MPAISDTIKTMISEASPFRADDVTVGIENEWQVCVIGAPDNIDLVQTILQSSHYRNLVKRTRSGDVPGHTLRSLDSWLHHNNHQVWENSWVRLPLQILNAAARACLDQDLLADKTRPESGRRSDADRFFVEQGEQPYLRIPVSYLLKLALLQATGTPGTADVVRRTADQIKACFLNDNTSPEICSFYPVQLCRDSEPGVAAARETLRRFLLTQLLTAYANTAMALKANGQQVVVYASPHPPQRQKQLNSLISDSFYRELFMSPCLSGWNDGQSKHRYMHLCHEVLSRSQLNAVRKMKEAGIIQNNLVILPSLSNTGLANNGVHISIGSRRLAQWMGDPDCAFKAAAEKNTADLVTKIVEYFLPLFVGTYSAAPYKLDFYDFHPETMLGFLPHELDHTHLRMMWRRWKKKGRFKVFGRALTPFGPVWLDRLVNRLLRFKGDFVPDFRLLDYPVALLSTNECPALDGTLGNDQRLLADLMDQGVFDNRMPVYLLWRLRDFGRMGFSGFEARYYSQFGDTAGDMPGAVCLQVLLTALAYRYLASGQVGHADIPDTPQIESERRQIFFCAAAGIPTFYIRRDSSSTLMQRVLARVQRTRTSRRYPLCTRVRIDEYRKALVRIIREDGADLISDLNAGPVLDDLETRLQPQSPSAVSTVLSAGIREAMGGKPVHHYRGDVFNSAAEAYYRDTLRHREVEQAFAVIAGDLPSLLGAAVRQPEIKCAMDSLFGTRAPADALAEWKAGFVKESLDGGQIEQLIHLLLIIIHVEIALNTTGS